jgi:hypothetical protein
MKRLISIVDLSNGVVTDRPSDTPTLDFPLDLDEAAPVADFDVHSRISYVAIGGHKVVRDGYSRPLSWRVRGEKCLVSTDANRATATRPREYAVFSVE